jgi:hypothetical protein
MSSFACQQHLQIKINNFCDAKKYDCLLQVPHPAILEAVNCVWGQLRRQVQLSDPFKIQMKDIAEWNSLTPSLCMALAHRGILFYKDFTGNGFLIKITISAMHICF